MRPCPLVLLTAIALVAASSCARHHEADVATAPAPVRDSMVVSLARDTLPLPGVSEVREYQGSYSSGYEVSWFEPCGAPRDDAKWWVTLSEDARLDRDSLLKLMPVRPRQGLAVRWRGTVSPKMRGGAGHMGQGSRYMLVTRILTLRALDGDGNGACSTLNRVGVLPPSRDAMPTLSR